MFVGLLHKLKWNRYLLTCRLNDQNGSYIATIIIKTQDKNITSTQKINIPLIIIIIIIIIIMTR